MSELSNNILNKIKEQKIQPKPKWQFLLKEYVIWFMFGLSIFFGSIAFSIILHFTKYGDYTYLHYNKNIIYSFIVLLPFLWILLLFIFWLIAFYNLKHSERGYKYRASFVLTLSIFLSFIFGIMLFSFGIGERVENFLEKKLTPYKSIEEIRQEFWSHPENGYLAGIVIEIIDENEFTLQDYKNDIWTIQLQKKVDINLLEKIEDKKIQISGEIIDKKNKVFLAEEIEPWNFRKRNIKIYIQTSKQNITKIIRIESEV